jgi:hypothetical protein
VDTIFAMIDWLSFIPRRVILKSFTNNKGRIKYRIGFNLFSAFWNWARSFPKSVSPIITNEEKPKKKIHTADGPTHSHAIKLKRNSGARQYLIIISLYQVLINQYVPDYIEPGQESMN